MQNAQLTNFRNGGQYANGFGASANSEYQGKQDLLLRENGIVALEAADVKVEKVLSQPEWQKAANEAQKEGAPIQSFEKAMFSDLMHQYEGVTNRPQPTLELAQAMLMTSNMKEAAANMNDLQMATAYANGHYKVAPTTESTSKNVSGVTSGEKVGSAPETISTGASYFYKQDYMADLAKKCASKDFAQVSKLVANLGPNDRSSNWFLEQRTLTRAAATQGREVRDLIENKIVDQMEYVRTKENIAQAKQRANQLLKDDDVSDNEKEKEVPTTNSGADFETEEDSGQAARTRKLNEQKINGIIKKIRQNGKHFLGTKDGKDYTHASLTSICKQLRKDQSWIKRREAKGVSKQQIDALKLELNSLEEAGGNQSKTQLLNRIQAIESVLGLEKRMKTDDVTEQTIAELDMKPLSTNAFDIQNVLFDYCGVNLTDQAKDSFSHQKRIERLFGKIRRLPKKSALMQNFDEKFFEMGDEESKIAKEPKHQELVKVVGLEPEKLFEKIPKYKIQVGKMPKFSNTFDSVDSVMPGLLNKHSILGQQIINPVASHMNFQRIDGRQVISLQFNPFLINDDQEKKKIYEGYMREIIEQRDKIKNAPKEAKVKQETANIKRAWINIVKKDIPKAYRLYQKFKADQEANNKKLSQNCLKEVRKKAVKTQRLAKESVVRARKLTKEMCQYWRKRDKEMADTKRKREKMDKEQKKRQQEEEEALLQKKRLEYLMQQSEIYAHFMAAKLGVADEHAKKKKEDGLEGTPTKHRVEIDRRAAMQNIAGIINENRKRLDDFDDHDREEIDADDLDEQKLQAPNQFNEKVTKPKMFLGDLKAYQLKGLQWLDNLYDQGINGILADEMGLGKTIQTIALLAHLAEKKNVWGPFLIVVPVTTLHNWQNELAKFCPQLKVLPYFGSAEERKKLAKFLDPKNLYNPAMCIHVLITSYNLIVGGGKDQMRLQRVKWHYMILDEAQAIKNNSSRRWKTLLCFNTRNRLLLSGTPIQNSMAELWALLHFIMPKLFDNHEQFQEWFSKDIEQHSMDQGELNKHQLKRLHLILQPFMLRRLKKDVEQEIAPKVEEIIQCDMTFRQKTLYSRIKSKISAADLFQLASSKAKMENLMNLVMQFRKVCNHPDLFERRIGKIPFTFCKMITGVQQNMSLVSKPEVYVANTNPITFELPKQVYDECFFITDNNTRLFTKYAKGLDESMATVSTKTHFSLFNIFNSENLHQQIYSNPQKPSFNNLFPILGLVMSSNNWGVGDISYMACADKLIQTISMMHYFSQRYHTKTYLNIHNSDLSSIHIPFGRLGMVYSDKTSFKSCRPDIMVNNFVTRDSGSLFYRSRIVENLDLNVEGQLAILEPLVPEHPKEFLKYSGPINSMMNIYYAKVTSEPINVNCASASFQRMFNIFKHNPVGKKALIGKNFKPKRDQYIGKVGKDRSSFLTENPRSATTPSGYPLLDNGLLDENFQIKGSATFQLPDYSRLVTDCSKMKILAELLARLHKEGHRCLIFCQMTRMMDILEDFLIWQKYSYFRMDGQTQLQDRRFMVEEFQSNPNIFIFILSTRAGGLGINLIAADTVIFYDNDWNPTMDSQATDRAHRIGQKKKVHVYRLVTKNSVEERILRRARQKESVQSTVYGANLKADSFSTRDVLDMIMDDIDDPMADLGSNRNQVKGFIKTGQKGEKKKKRKNKKKEGETGPDYSSVPRMAAHNRYENEIEKLLDGMELPVSKPKADIEMIDGNRESSDDDGAASDSSVEDIKYPATANDRKEFLMKMLEKQTGGAKTTFAFEEDDAPFGGAVRVDEPSKRRGRPKNKEMEADEDEDEDMEDPEY